MVRKVKFRHFAPRRTGAALPARTKPRATRATSKWRLRIQAAVARRPAASCVGERCGHLHRRAVTRCLWRQQGAGGDIRAATFVGAGHLVDGTSVTSPVENAEASRRPRDEWLRTTRALLLYLEPRVPRRILGISNGPTACLAVCRRCGRKYRVMRSTGRMRPHGLPLTRVPIGLSALQRTYLSHWCQ